MKSLFVLAAFSLSFSSFAIVEEVVQVCGRDGVEKVILKRDCTGEYYSEVEGTQGVSSSPALVLVQSGPDIQKSADVSDAASAMSIDLESVSHVEIIRLSQDDSQYRMFRFHSGKRMPIAVMQDSFIGFTQCN